MDEQTRKEKIASEAKKAAEAIKNSCVKTKESLNQIKAEKESDLAKKKNILNQFIEESDKFKAKKDKELDLMNERLKSAAQGNDPNALFAEMDKLSDMMNSYSDDEVIQAVKDRQLKDAKTD